MTTFISRALAVAAALLLVVAADGVAQDTGVAGDRLVSVSLYGGNFSPTHELKGPIFESEPFEFESNPTFGGSIGHWGSRYVGVRVSGLWTETMLNDPDAFPLDGRDASVLMFSGDLLVRYPLEAAGGVVFPYGIGGMGAKSYSFDIETTSSGGFIDYQGDTDVALNFGAGLEYRFGGSGRWGLNVEVKDYWSKFGVAGIEGAQHDLVWTGGLSLQF